MVALHFSGDTAFRRGGEILLPPLQPRVGPFPYTRLLQAEDAKRAETHTDITEDSDILCTFPLIAPAVWAPSSVGRGAFVTRQ